MLHKIEIFIMSDESPKMTKAWVKDAVEEHYKTVHGREPDKSDVVFK